MSVTILGNPAVLWDFYMSGGYYENAALATDYIGALNQYVVPAYSPGRATLSTPRQAWTHSQGGSGVLTTREPLNGVMCWKKLTTVVASIDGGGGMGLMPRIDRSGMAPGFRNPSWQRVHWFSFSMAMDVGTLDRNSGMLLVLTGGAQTAAIWPIAPAIAFFSGFGITGDAAGNWNWESFGEAPNPAPVLESVSLASAIADPSDFNTFDFVMISASSARPAVFELWINGVLFLQRNWETGTVLPPYIATSGRWVPVWQVATTSGEALFMSDWEFRMGRFLPDGRELFQ